jgi:hypothetical protein
MGERARRVFDERVEVVVRRHVAFEDQAADAGIGLHALDGVRHLRRVAVMVLQREHRLGVLALPGEESGHHLDPLERGRQVFVSHEYPPFGAGAAPEFPERPPNRRERGGSG